MADITITITADEDDLRHVAAFDHGWARTNRIAAAILAALPKPRIHPQPGDVLRRRSDGRTVAIVNARRNASWLLDSEANDDFTDPGEWEILTAAEIAEAFERKRLHGSRPGIAKPWGTGGKHDRKRGGA